MGNIKYEINKHKKKIALGLSVVTLGAISFGVYKYVTKDSNPPTTNEEYSDKEQILAKYIFNANSQGEIGLLEVSTGTVNKSVNIGDNSNLYASSNDLDKMMVFSKGTFYELLETNGEIVKNEIVKIKDSKIKEFKFSENYIVAIKDNEITTVSLKDKTINNFPIKDIGSYIVFKDLLVFSNKDELTILDIKNNKTKLLNVGEKIVHFNILNNNSIVAFSEFGKGVNKNSILTINTDTLNVDKGIQHHSLIKNTLINDSDDKEVCFVDEVEKNNLKLNSLNKIDITSKKNEKNRIALPTSQENIDYKNSVSTKGYLYSSSKGDIQIFDQRAESVKTAITIDSNFFMPILK